MENCPNTTQCNWLDCFNLGLDSISCELACQSYGSVFCGLCDPSGHCTKVEAITDLETCIHTSVCWLSNGDMMLNLTKVMNCVIISELYQVDCEQLGQCDQDCFEEMCTAGGSVAELCYSTNTTNTSCDGEWESGQAICIYNFSQSACLENILQYEVSVLCYTIALMVGRAAIFRFKNVQLAKVTPPIVLTCSKVFCNVM